MDSIRCFDIIFSSIGLIILSPVLIIIAAIIILSSKGPVLYRQKRVGKEGRDFEVLKFRSMYANADKKGLLTVGEKDNRITKAGYYLRKFKLDELPQLFNVLAGDMSVVGPRPEVRRYVDLYSEEQRKALRVLPGITDYASIFYRNENDLLARTSNPEEFYVNEIMPKKIEMNFIYINNRTIKEYLKIIIKTVFTSAKGK